MSGIIVYIDSKHLCVDSDRLGHIWSCSLNYINVKNHSSYYQNRVGKKTNLAISGYSFTKTDVFQIVTEGHCETTVGAKDQCEHDFYHVKSLSTLFQQKTLSARVVNTASRVRGIEGGRTVSDACVKQHEYTEYNDK